MSEADLLSPGGIRMGRTPYFPVTARLGRVVERIARGLYFREFGAPLPPTHEVAKAEIDQFGRQLQTLQRAGLRVSRRPVVGCGGQFASLFAMTRDYPASGIWVGELYGRVWAVAFLRRLSRRWLPGQPG